MGKTNDQLSSQAQEPAMAVTGDAAAMWFWAERFLGGGWRVPFQKELQTSVNMQVHPPPHPSCSALSSSQQSGSWWVCSPESHWSIRPLANEKFVSCSTEKSPRILIHFCCPRAPLWFCSSPERWGSWRVGLLLESIPDLVYPSIRMPMYLVIYLSIYTFTYVFTYLPIHLSIYLCIYWFTYPSIHMPMYLVIYLRFPDEG